MDPEDNPEPDAPSKPRSILELVQSLIDDVIHLLFQETELAKAEISDSIRKAGRGAIIMAAGAAVLVSGFMILMFAAAVGVVALIQLFTGLSVISSILVGLSSSGLLMAIVGIIAVLIAKKKLSPQELKPRRTVETLKGAKDWAEDKLHG